MNREIILLKLDRTKYGLWKDEVPSIKEIRNIHWLPPTPPYIAGMSSLNGRAMGLLDLSACMGHSPISREKRSYVLLTPGQEKTTGFLVEGDTGRTAIPPDAVFHIPHYLKTPVIDTCVRYGPEPVPVINISMLYSLMRTADRKPPVPECLAPRIQQKDMSSVKNVRVFEIAGQSFAVSTAGIKKEPQKSGPVSRLALLPQYVRGVTFHNGQAFPLIHLSQRMELAEKGTGELMFVADIGDQSFGFLVDSDRGTLFQKDFKLNPLPQLVQSDWVQSTVIHREEIIPVIDLGVLMSTRPDGENKNSLQEIYNPDSGFQDIIRKQAVEVVEFSLLGRRHALPKSEVEDTLRFKPCRQVPNVRPIVSGVTEHEGELLPVLDLATCFGRRSSPTAEWKMILVKNGDFRALVITEAVLGERQLEMEMQRELPFEEPYTLVYGCYPDDRAVRLILNVEALAVHFDKEMSKELLSHFLPLTLTESEAGPELEPEKPVETQEEKGGEALGFGDPGDIEDLVTSMGPGEMEDEKKIQVEFEEHSPEEQSVGVSTYDEPEPIETEVTIELGLELEPGQADEAQKEKGRESSGVIESGEIEDSVAALEFWKIEEEEESAGAKEGQTEQVADLEGFEDIEGLKEHLDSHETKEEGKDIKAEIEEPAHEEQDVALSTSDEAKQVQDEVLEDVEPEPEEAVEIQEEQIREDSGFLKSDEIKKLAASLESWEAGEEEKKEIKVESEELFYDEQGSALPALSGTEPAQDEVSEEVGFEQEIDIVGVESESGEGISSLDYAKRQEEKDIQEPEEFTLPENGVVPPVESARDYLAVSASKKRRRRLMLMLAITLAIALMYFSGVFEIKNIDKFINKKPEKPVALVKPVPAPEVPTKLLPAGTRQSISVNSEIQQGKKHNVLSGIDRKENEKLEGPVVIDRLLSAPLELIELPELETSPATLFETRIYDVKKGDTLWWISHRFTGTGFNYPSIADENRIINPDLIFPDQRIVITGKE